MMPGYAPRSCSRDVQLPLWRTMQADREPRSIVELHSATRATPNSIQHRLSRWRQAGLVARIDGTPPRFIMTAPDTPLPPVVALSGRCRPRTPNIRERLWHAMRVLRTFDMPQLKLAASATRRSTEDYVNCLLRAGYLRRIGSGNGMTGTWSRYTLIRNAGRIAPKVCHGAKTGGRRLLVDPNSGSTVDISPNAVSLRREDGGAC